MFVSRTFHQYGDPDGDVTKAVTQDLGFPFSSKGPLHLTVVASYDKQRHWGEAKNEIEIGELEGG
jgi:hypothetical protein